MYITKIINTVDRGKVKRTSDGFGGDVTKVGDNPGLGYTISLLFIKKMKGTL